MSRFCSPSSALDLFTHVKKILDYFDETVEEDDINAEYKGIGDDGWDRGKSL